MKPDELLTERTMDDGMTGDNWQEKAEELEGILRSIS